MFNNAVANYFGHTTEKKLTKKRKEKKKESLQVAKKNIKTRKIQMTFT